MTFIDDKIDRGPDSKNAKRRRVARRSWKPGGEPVATQTFLRPAIRIHRRFVEHAKDTYSSRSSALFFFFFFFSPFHFVARLSVNFVQKDGTKGKEWAGKWDRVGREFPTFRTRDVRLCVPRLRRYYLEEDPPRRQPRNSILVTKASVTGRSQLFYGCLSTSIMAALSRVVYPGAQHNSSCTKLRSTRANYPRDTEASGGLYRLWIIDIDGRAGVPWRKPRRQLPHRDHPRSILTTPRAKERKRAVANLRR